MELNDKPDEAVSKTAKENILIQSRPSDSRAIDDSKPLEHPLLNPLVN